MKTLVLIPCYNEEANIVRVVERLKSTCPDVDYLVINDCSRDRSEEILRENGDNYLTLPVNLGIGGGVQCGYRYAAYLNKVVGPVARGEMDMCIGSRFITKEGFQTSPLRRFGINVLSWLILLLTGLRVRDLTSGFRACGKEMTNYFADHYAPDYPEPEAILDAVLNGYTVGEAPVIMQERQGGVSSIHSFKSAYYMIKVSLSLIVHRLGSHPKKRRKNA